MLIVRHSTPLVRLLGSGWALRVKCPPSASYDARWVRQEAVRAFCLVANTKILISPEGDEPKFISVTASRPLIGRSGRQTADFGVSSSCVITPPTTRRAWARISAARSDGIRTLSCLTARSSLASLSSKPRPSERPYPKHRRCPRRPGRPATRSLSALTW